ncbi:MAG TPA: macro domain-containing protein [Pyrinomonadaceae bacterium]|nr:macro domain-containing protein [Pyrinomonadaceae bacterium]
MRIISDTEAIRHILQHKHHYICYLGAGASAEAGIKTAQSICDDIRGQLLPEGLSPRKLSQWEREKLNWDIPSRKYSTCMRAYGNAVKRVQYFREILKGKPPAFCQFALALLMADGVFKRTCLTTNFDKLLESAFTHRGMMECQPIRTDDELKYWEDDQERCYVIKLHGDYDTNNILNTDDEVISINDTLKEKVKDLAKDAGMLVVGTAGYEKSVHTLFDLLTKDGSEKVLSYGVLWGVYVPDAKPKNLTQEGLEKLLGERISGGEVGPDIVAMMNRMSLRNEDFCFFPLWGGAGNFMFDLIEKRDSKPLKETAKQYLDHEMRLRAVFRNVEMTDVAFKKHLTSLKEQRKKLLEKLGAPSPTIENVYEARSRDGRVVVSVAYGNIAKRSWMGAPEFRHVARAVVSPEDTCISAGGGVAYLILERAGKYAILNELSKFPSPIKHGRLVVTSGGNLPVHYIFHAAAIEITRQGKYIVTRQDVRKTMTEVLERAKGLGVGAVWVPLMGAGVGSLGPRQSFEGILEAIGGWKPGGHEIIINVAIYKERELPRNVVRQLLQQKLSKHFTVRPFSDGR